MTMHDPSATIWEATGKPLSVIGAGRYRLTGEFLYFEKGTLSTSSQQIPVHEIVDVDAKQSLQQKARSVGTITLSAQRATGVEVITLDDVPGHREGVQAINNVARMARERRMTQANTQTVHHAGHAPAPVAAVAAPAPVEPEAAPVDPIAMLEQLGKLRDAGVLTPEEFEAKKAEILSRI